MKKTVCSLLATLALSTITAASAFAFQMSQPQKIGSVDCFFNMGGGYSFQGANQIKAAQYYNNIRQRYTGYGKGYATFDGGKLYAHILNPRNPIYKIGDKDINNTINTIGSVIYKIKTDSGITLYWLYGGEESSGFILIGRRADGRYVKYVDGDKVFKDFVYNGRGLAGINQLHSVSGDSIFVSYGPKGALIKLQWDEKAQWFGVARIR